MKLKLLFLFLLLSTVGLRAQEYMFGNVTSEFGDNLPNVIIYNSRTDEKVVTNREGTFMIAAKVGDQLRILKSGFERVEHRLIDTDFTKPLKVSLKQNATLIPEVELVFVPTGDIKKDTKMLNPPKKVVALNNEVKTWMKQGPKEVYPQSKVPSAFQAPNYNVGQVDIVRLVRAVADLINKGTDPKSSPNYAETEKFYQKVRASIDINYFKGYGLSDYELDKFFAYAEENLKLSKNYRNNFNKNSIEIALKGLLKDYIKIMNKVS